MTVASNKKGFSCITNKLNVQQLVKQHFILFDGLLYTYTLIIIQSSAIVSSEALRLTFAMNFYNHFKDERIPLESYSMSFDDVTYETLLFLIIFSSVNNKILEDNSINSQGSLLLKTPKIGFGLYVWMFPRCLSVNRNFQSQKISFSS